jgi:hypothetical protein
MFWFEACLREKSGQAEYSKAREDVTEALLCAIILVCTHMTSDREARKHVCSGKPVGSIADKYTLRNAAY